nr:MAG TPA: hypothetical protein [Bacteriophage sp.]
MFGSSWLLLACWLIMVHYAFSHYSSNVAQYIPFK